MKIGVLTSGRADYGVYNSLLSDLSGDDFFDLHIIAFGMHLMPKYGNTIEQIKQDKFGQIHEVIDLLTDDDTLSIAKAYARVCDAFAKFYNDNSFDLVVALGDRFEMNAAVQAGIPFNVRFAHIHAGETTLGAIDNIYRHQISLASELLFTATEDYQNEATKYNNRGSNVYNVGALSLDNIEIIAFDEKDFFIDKFDLPNKEYALVTFHPETVRANENEKFAREMYDALLAISHDIYIVVTMPNADTSGSVYREKLQELKKEIPNQISLIENFGKRHYFNAMHYAKFMLGNTSSGIIEAASFGKYVINVGARQEGRSQSTNVLNCNFEARAIIEQVDILKNKGNYKGENVYFQNNVAPKIIEKIKQYFEKL